MKNLYTVSLSICAIFLLFVFYKANQETNLRYEMYSDWQNGSDSNVYTEIRELSFTSSLISQVFILFYILTFSFSFKYLKTTTSKVMNILGVCFSGIAFLITLLPIVDPGKISFEELSYLLVPFILAMIAFSIVNLIQAYRIRTADLNQSTIDDII